MKLVLELNEKLFRHNNFFNRPSGSRVMTENIFSRVIAINHKISFFQNRELIRFYRAQLWNRDIMANLKMYNSEMAHFARVS